MIKIVGEADTIIFNFPFYIFNSGSFAALATHKEKEEGKICLPLRFRFFLP